MVRSDTKEYQDAEQSYLKQIEEYKKLRELFNHPAWPVFISKINELASVASETVMTSDIPNEHIHFFRGQYSGLIANTKILDEVNNEGRRVHERLAKLRESSSEEVE